MRQVQHPAVPVGKLQGNSVHGSVLVLEISDMLWSNEILPISCLPHHLFPCQGQLLSLAHVPEGIQVTQTLRSVHGDQGPLHFAEIDCQVRLDRPEVIPSSSDILLFDGEHKDPHLGQSGVSLQYPIRNVLVEGPDHFGELPILLPDEDIPSDLVHVLIVVDHEDLEADVQAVQHQAVAPEEIVFLQVVHGRKVCIQKEVCLVKENLSPFRLLLQLTDPVLRDPADRDQLLGRLRQPVQRLRQLLVFLHCLQSLSPHFLHHCFLFC